MKRVVINLLIFFVFGVGIMTGCTRNDSGSKNSVLEEPILDTSDSNDAETIVVDESKSNVDDLVNVEEQIGIIADNIHMWSIPDDLGVEMNAYVVTDLDQNGRLEIIASVMGGSGLYTTSDIYEMNESMDGLSKVTWQKAEGDSEPDIQVDSSDVYYSVTEDKYSYIMDDFLRAGAAYSLVTKRSFSVRDGSVSDVLLASWVTEATGVGSEVTEIYHNASQEVISKDDFEHIAEAVYVGDEKGRATFSWIRYYPYDEATRIKELSKEDLIDQLKGSYEGFSVKID